MPPAIFAFILWNNADSNCSAVVQLTDAGVWDASGVKLGSAVGPVTAPAVCAGCDAASAVAAAARTAAVALP